MGVFGPLSARSTGFVFFSALLYFQWFLHNPSVPQPVAQPLQQQAQPTPAKPPGSTGTAPPAAPQPVVIADGINAGRTISPKYTPLAAVPKREDPLPHNDWGEQGNCECGSRATASERRLVPAARTTLVTAYYNITSKHTHEEYLRWMDNLLSVADDLYVFTDDAMMKVPGGSSMKQKDYILKRRKEISIGHTHVEVMELNAKTTFAVDPDNWTEPKEIFSNGALWINQGDKEQNKHLQAGHRFWTRQHQIDPEGATHHKDVKLYWIWLEKTEWVRRAAHHNPFGATFFTWIDIGYLRGPGGTSRFKAWNKRLIRWLPCDFKRDENILMLDVSNLLDLSRKYIGGGFIFGSQKGIDAWHKLFYKVLGEVAQLKTVIGGEGPGVDGRQNAQLKLSNSGANATPADAERWRAQPGMGFVGKDQPVMRQICVEHPGLCYLVLAERGNTEDPWMYMTEFLHSGPHHLGGTSGIQESYPMMSLADLGPSLLEK